MKKILQIIGLLVVTASFSFGQTGSINLKNGYIVENGGNSTTPIYLILSYGQPSALSRTNGWIISEGEFNNVRWYIDQNIGSYTVPYGYSNSSYIPVNVTISSAGVHGGGSAYIDFSTYHTPPLNTANMPLGGYGDPPNLQPAFGPGHPSPTDNSYEVVDRFWFIYAQSYGTKPTLSSIQLNYINTGGNTEVGGANLPWLTETNLFAQRYNPTVGKGWGDWTGTGGTDLAIPGNGYATSGSVIPANFYRVWTLTNSTSPLPIQISSFTGQCDNGVALIQWTSQSELNNDYYTVKKTMDNVHFETVGTVKGAGTSSMPNNYSIIDNSPFGGTSYYYLYQTDFDNTTNPAGNIAFTGCSVPSATTFNGYNTTNFIEIQINSVGADNYDISLVNLLGQSVINETHSVVLGNNEIRLNNNISPGVYILNVKNAKYNYTKKLVVGVR